MLKPQDSDQPLDSLEYEEFVARSFETLQLTGIGTLTRNRHFLGKSGHSHQIDIAIEIAVATLQLLVIVECKCYRRSVEVADVLEFVSRIQDIGASKGVMVTTIGFQEGAVRLAKSHHVALIVTAPRTPITVVLASRAEERILKRREDGQWQLELPVRPAQPPVPHTTLDFHPSAGASASFRQAWRAIVGATFQNLVRAEVQAGRIRLDIRCPSCHGLITEFMRGCCRVCRRPLRTDSLATTVWIQCDCGRKAHRTEIETTVAICACGSPRAALSQAGLVAAELRRLFAELRIDT